MFHPPVIELFKINNTKKKKIENLLKVYNKDKRAQYF